MSHFQVKSLPLAISLAFSPLSLLCSSAMAADVAAIALPSVTVIDSKVDNTAPSASKLNKSSLAPRLSATSDTASLLSDVPGVSLYGAGGVSSLPAIHGLADDRLRIKVDGMDLIASCPNHMNPALSYLDPTNIGTLKVFAGIAPVSSGGDSIGGTILAESRAPEFAAAGQSITKGELGAFYRSNNKARGLNLSATHATDAFNISYSGSTSKADNTIAGADFKTYDFSGRLGHDLARNEVGSTAYETRNQTVGLAFGNDNHRFQAKLGFQDMPFQLYPNQRMDLLNNTQQSVNLRYAGQFDWGALEARAYQERVDHSMDFGADKRYWYGSGAVVPGSSVSSKPCAPVGATCAAGMPMLTEGKTTGLGMKADMALGQQDVLRAGGEVQQYRINDWWPASGGGMYPGTFWNIRDGQRDRSAVFAEWEARRSAQWMTLLGARYEQVNMDAGNAIGYNPAGGGNQARDANAFNALSHKTTDNNVDLTAATRYTASDNYAMEFGFAHKTRSPNVYERFTWSTWQMAALMNNFVGDGNGYFGNLALKPEQANKLSATFDWHAADGSWGFKATPYTTQVADYIDAVQWNATTNQASATPVKGRFSVLRYVNQSARIYGLDLSGHMPLAKSSMGDFGLKGLLNYTHGTNQDTGDGLYNIMPLNAKLVLTHKLEGWDNSLELLMVQAKDTVSGVRNETKTPGYGLVNLRTSYAWKQVRLDFGVENLFDKFYYLPTGGAYTGQGTTMSNPALPNYPQWGTAVAGMGRSVYMGLNFKF